MKTILFSVTLLLCSSCATKFTGSAYIEKNACYEKCQEWGMSVSGMVAMGEYSSACVCSPSNSVHSKTTLLNNATSAISGSVGVITKMKDDQQATQNGNMMNMMH